VKPGIQFYTDAAMIDQAIRPLIKNAGSPLLSSLISTVKSYAESKLAAHDGDKFATLADVLVPGILWSGFGLRWLAVLVQLSESYFGLSPGRLLESAWHMISTAVKTGSVTAEEVQQAAGIGIETTSNLRAYRLVAMGSKQLTIFAAAKSTNASLMSRIVYWVLLAALAGAGITVAGEIFNKITGHESAKPTASGWLSLHPESGAAPAASSQTVLKPSESYAPEHNNQNSIWMEAVPPSGIGALISQWAMSIYPDLQGHEDMIESSSRFHATVSHIQDYNKANATQYTFIPEGFASKKQIVDMFADDLAAKYQGSQSAPKPAATPVATKSSSVRHFERMQAFAQELAPREMSPAQKTETAFNLPSITDTFGLSGKFDVSGKDVSMPSANIGGVRVSPDVIGKATKFIAPPDGSKNQTNLFTNKGKLTVLPGFAPILPKQQTQPDSMAQQQPAAASQANKPVS
jgi:hypothetical protein